MLTHNPKPSVIHLAAYEGGTHLHILSAILVAAAVALEVLDSGRCDDPGASIPRPDIRDILTTDDDIADC